MKLFTFDFFLLNQLNRLKADQKLDKFEKTMIEKLNRSIHVTHYSYGKKYESLFENSKSHPHILSALL